MKQENKIKIKNDPKEGLVILSKQMRGETRTVPEKKQCTGCPHLREAVMVKESLLGGGGENETQVAGVCTLGHVWRIVKKEEKKELEKCARLTMNLKDSFGGA